MRKGLCFDMGLEKKVNLEKLNELRERKQRIYQMGGSRQLENQRKRGKLNLRERLALLFDKDSFSELDMLVKHRCTQFGMETKEIAADAAISGYGRVGGRPVFFFGQDFTSAGGTLGEMHGQKACKVLDMAHKAGAPFVQIIDSGGLRLQEGQDASEWYAQMFRRHTLYNGVIPQVSLLMGPCAGGAAYGPALTDFIIMVKGTAFMYMGGPAFVKTVLGYDATEEELGGAMVHAKVTGMADLVAENEEEAIGLAQKLLGFLPSNNRCAPPHVTPSDSPMRKTPNIMDILPESSKAPFNMSRIITDVVDDGELFQIKPEFARNMITGYARLNGHTVGIVANQPMFKGGVIDVDAADKAARFVRICDSFNIPLVQFQDCTGVMIGKDEERKGIIRHGSKMLYSYTEATVPKITLVVRHSYAGAQVCMCNKPIGADIMLAWPTAEITTVAAETASSIIFAKEISSSPNPEETSRQKLEEYYRLFINPYVAAERGYIEDVIEPEETRSKLIGALEALINKHDQLPAKKHSNLQM